MTLPVAHQLHKIRSMPYGTARTSAAEAITRKIEAEGPNEHLAEALLDLVEAYTFAGQAEKSFVVFARALRLWDASPELFDESDTHNLFWEFKWVAGDLADYPQITRAQAEAFLDDMQRRFELQGTGLSAVRAARFSWTWQSGALGAEEARLAWIASPRDAFDDCEACIIGRQTDFFIEQGRFRETLDLGLTQEFSCNIEPTKTFHAAALAALNLGEAERARELHGRALASLTTGNRDLAQSRGQSFELLARGGHLERALRELRGDYRDLLTEPPSPLQHLRFLLGIIAGLSANLDRGHVPTGIAMPGASHESGDMTVAELHAWAIREARAHAERFDARVETKYYHDLLIRAQDAQQAPVPLDFGAEHIPASRDTRAPVSGQAADETARDDSEASSLRNASSETDMPSAEAAAETGRADAGTGIAKLWGKITDAATGKARRGRDQAGGDANGADPAAQLTADGLMARASEHVGRREYTAAARDYEQAVALFEAGGWLERAGLAAAEAGQCSALDRNEERSHHLFARALPLLRSGGADAGTLAAVLAAWAPVAARMNDAESQILVTEAVLREHPEFDATGLSEELAERKRQEWAAHRATLRDTLARSIAASRGRVFPGGLDSERAASEALLAGEEFARIGLLEDASHAFWLAGKIQVDRGETEAAVWGLESAFEGFTAAQKRKDRLRVAGELIDLLKRTGQSERAEAVVAAL